MNVNIISFQCSIQLDLKLAHSDAELVATHSVCMCAYVRRCILPVIDFVPSLCCSSPYKFSIQIQSCNEAGDFIFKHNYFF